MEATEAEEPDDALPALEAPVSLVPEEEQTDPGVALACVGMRADFEVHPPPPQLSEQTPSTAKETWKTYGLN